MPEIVTHRSKLKMTRVSSFRRWFLYAILALIALVGVILAIGWSLPVAHTATRSRVVPASPDRVFALVAGFADYPSWRSDVTRVDVSGDPGVGRQVRESSSFGDIPYRVEAWDPPRRLVTRITATDLGFGGTWTYEFQPDAGGTRVTITEDGEVYRAFFRVMSRFVFGHTATIDRYLTDLDAAVRGTSGAARFRP